MGSLDLFNGSLLKLVRTDMQYYLIQLFNYLMKLFISFFFFFYRIGVVVK